MKYAVLALALALAACGGGGNVVSTAPGPYVTPVPNTTPTNDCPLGRYEDGSCVRDHG